MKKTLISISYDSEKLAAIKLYLNQKERSVENELTAAVDNLYIRIVPANVRDFIDLRESEQDTEKKNSSKSSETIDVKKELNGAK